MVLLLIFLALIVGCVCMWNYTYDDIWGLLSWIVIALTLLFFVIGIPVARIGTHLTIERIEITQQTVDRARMKGQPLELAAIQQKVVEINQELVTSQYLNEHGLDWWIPDTIMAVKPIH